MPVSTSYLQFNSFFFVTSLYLKYISNIIKHSTNDINVTLHTRASPEYMDSHMFFKHHLQLFLVL